MATPQKRRRVVPKKRTATQQAAYNKQQKKTPKRGMVQDNLGKLKADAAREAKNMPKPKGGERIPTPAERYAVKPGNPNFRSRSNTQPASRPLTPPQQQKMRELQKAAGNMVKLNKQTPTSSKLARRRALPIMTGTPRANPYGFAVEPGLDPNFLPPPMTPPQQDMLRRLFASYNNEVNAGRTRPLSNKQYNNIFGSMFGRRP